MTDGEYKALLALLDDSDAEVRKIVWRKIDEIGVEMLPFVEEQLLLPQEQALHESLTELARHLRYQQLKQRLVHWKQNGSDLLQGMWLISTYQYPETSIDDLRREIDQLYFEAWIDFRTELLPYDQVKVLNSVLFDKLKFKGNVTDFHDVANSYIHDVLQRKIGNPISLCVIYMLIAQKLEMPVFGVNLPNLFVLTYKQDALQFYINVFNKGLIFTRRDLDDYINRLQISPDEVFYQPCNNIDILRRVLRNIIVSYEKDGEAFRAEEIKGLLKVLNQE